MQCARSIAKEEDGENEEEDEEEEEEEKGARGISHHVTESYRSFSEMRLTFSRAAFSID